MDTLKQKAAEAALSYIKPGDVIGVGTGSTVAFFIQALVAAKPHIDGAVASSVATENALRDAGIRVLELNETGTLPLYIDGADEADRHLRLIKGGGGALTREKVIAQASRKFVCIIDDSKLEDRLGAFPLPIEVLPMARSFVARETIRLGGAPEWRADYLTDNDNAIIDVAGLDLTDPAAMETQINNLPGVVTCGLFAHRPADALLVASEGGVDTLTRS